MINYFKKSFQRKIARRFFKKYPHEISRFQLSDEGEVEFANWNNPLVVPKTLMQSKVNFFKKFISKGDLCIDIGANIGEQAISIALAAGKEGLVVAFDPNPHAFEILELNSKLNKDKTNIVPFPFAITEQEGEFYYNSDEASFANGGISKNLSGYHGHHMLKSKVKGINLEEFFKSNYGDWLSKLSFIKVDVEGYDKEIIRSISPIIQKYKPVIIAECFAKSTAAERIELYETVKGNGYDLFYFEDFVENTTVIKLEKNDMTKWKHFDFYAIPVKK